jgi:hypothetical protein
VALPTAGDTIVRSAPGGQTLVRVNNDSVRLMPFSGLIWAPNDRWYSQTLLQLDTATNGNPAYLGFPGSTTIPPGGLAQVGKLQYPTFLYLSFSGGYWLYKNDRGRLTGHIGQLRHGGLLGPGKVWTLRGGLVCGGRSCHGEHLFKRPGCRLSSEASW